MENSYIIIVSSLLIMIGIYFIHFRKQGFIHETISKIPEKKLSTIADQEEVRVRGHIVYAGKTMLAPLTKKECVYYRVVVKDRSHSDELLKNNINLEEEWAADVVIKEKDHYAVIDMKTVSASIAMDVEMHSGFWNISTPELKEFLAKHGERTDNYVGWSPDLFAEEGILEEGEEITVAGKGVWRSSSEFGLKLPEQKILYIGPLKEEGGVFMTDNTSI